MTAANPAIKPYWKRGSVVRPHASGSGPWAVPDLCAAYKLPTGLTGGGIIGIVELGGGWAQADLDAYFKSIGQPVPSVTDVSVDGTKNKPDPDPNGADGEVALDIEVAAAAYYYATGSRATIRVYWSTDIATAVSKAVDDGCDVISISWGADEAAWSSSDAQRMEAAALAANAAGIPVFAAAGDNDSGDGGPTPANVDLPASAPHIIGCGGTSKTRSAETVWQNNPGQSNGEGTGGGYSTLFPAQAWQVGAPPAPNGLGRMVPDVSANADPNTGYEIYFHGSKQVIGGTSAVAPLYAGLFAAFGSKVGKRFGVNGAMGPALWANPLDFADITSGENGTYKAQVGPDACTGLGVPTGRLAAFSFGTPAPGPAPTPAPPAPAPTPTPVPAPSSAPTLAQAQAWAVSEIDKAVLPMTPSHAKKLAEAGLAANWPK